MFFKKNRDSILFGIALFAFTAYLLLDTFVTPRSYESASQAEHTAESQDTASNTADTNEKEIHIASEDSTASDTASSESDGTDSDLSSKHPTDEDGKQRGRHKRSSSQSFNSEAGDTETKSTDSESKSTQQTLDLSEGTVIDTYSGEDKTITLYEYRVEDTEIYVADVVLQSAGTLKTAFADETYGKNITAKTSEVASNHEAVLAINGDFYGARENGYVIRNGTLYRDTSAGDQEDLVIYEDGSFEIINESSVTAQELLEKGAQQVFAFGPALLLDGTVAVSADEEVGKAMASNPRTAIGIVDDLHYVFVVSDGRTEESEGLSLSELAGFMNTLGVTTAYNLDGGGSSTMYFNGKVINQPTTSGRNIKERSVSDIVYIQ